MKIANLTFGMGDRFAHEGEARLQAIIAAQRAGIDVHPVWNKSHREHLLVHVAFKVAAKIGVRFTDALAAHREIIAANVTHNLLERHIRPLFA